MVLLVSLLILKGNIIFLSLLVEIRERSIIDILFDNIVIVLDIWYDKFVC